MLLKIITNMLKKVLFIDDKNRQQVHNIGCVGLKLTFCAMLLSWFWPERASIENMSRLPSFVKKTVERMFS